MEDAATEAVLRDMGCNRAQGYFYAPPMPVEQFIAWWEARRDMPLEAGAPA